MAVIAEDTLGLDAGQSVQVNEIGRPQTGCRRVAGGTVAEAIWKV
jgi:hypothetical protein